MSKDKAPRVLTPWVTPCQCIFLNKVIRPNTTIQIYYMCLLLYITTCFGCPDQPSSFRCRIHKNKCTMIWYIC